MDLRTTDQLETPPQPDLADVWDQVLGKLRLQLSRTDYDTWVEPLVLLGCGDGVLRLGAHNAFARDYVDKRMNSMIRRLASGLFKSELKVDVVVVAPPAGGKPSRNGAGRKGQSALVDVPAEPAPEPAPPRAKGSPRKMSLIKAYGTKRAAVIKPEKTLFVTDYYLTHWLPRLGHSAWTVILAARRMCFWNPTTGERRDEVDTDMSTLAEMAGVSVRTVKAVLKMEDVRAYFLRYRVRRVQTSYGVRTAGITIKVRMDDPLTPEDQQEHELPEDPRWYTDPNLPSLYDDEDED